MNMQQFDEDPNWKDVTLSEVSEPNHFEGILRSGLNTENYLSYLELRSHLSSSAEYIHSSGSYHAISTFDVAEILLREQIDFPIAAVTLAFIFKDPIVQQNLLTNFGGLKLELRNSDNSGKCLEIDHLLELAIDLKDYPDAILVNGAIIHHISNLIQKLIIEIPFSKNDDDKLIIAFFENADEIDSTVFEDLNRLASISPILARLICHSILQILTGNTSEDEKLRANLASYIISTIMQDNLHASDDILSELLSHVEQANISQASIDEIEQTKVSYLPFYRQLLLALKTDILGRFVIFSNSQEELDYAYRWINIIDSWFRSNISSLSTNIIRNEEDLNLKTTSLARGLAISLSDSKWLDTAVTSILQREKKYIRHILKSLTDLNSPLGIEFKDTPDLWAEVSNKFFIKLLVRSFENHSDEDFILDLLQKQSWNPEFIKYSLSHSFLLLENLSSTGIKKLFGVFHSILSNKNLPVNEVEVASLKIIDELSRLLSSPQLSNKIAKNATHIALKCLKAIKNPPSKQALIAIRSFIDNLDQLVFERPENDDLHRRLGIKITNEIIRINDSQSWKTIYEFSIEEESCNNAITFNFKNAKKEITLISVNHSKTFHSKTLQTFEKNSASIISKALFTQTNPDIILDSRDTNQSLFSLYHWLGYYISDNDTRRIIPLCNYNDDNGFSAHDVLSIIYTHEQSKIYEEQIDFPSPGVTKTNNWLKNINPSMTIINLSEPGLGLLNSQESTIFSDYLDNSIFSIGINTILKSKKLVLFCPNEDSLSNLEDFFVGAFDKKANLLDPQSESFSYFAVLANHPQILVLLPEHLYPIALQISDDLRNVTI